MLNDHDDTTVTLNSLDFDRRSGIKMIKKNEESIEQTAVKNYEMYNKLRPGSATLDQVKKSSGGIEMYAKWTPPKEVMEEYQRQSL